MVEDSQTWKESAVRNGGKGSWRHKMKVQLVVGRTLALGDACG